MPRLACLRACASGQLAQCRSMMHYNELVPAQPALLLHADRLRLAVAAYLARFKGTSRDHSRPAAVGTCCSPTPASTGTAPATWAP